MGDSRVPSCRQKPQSQGSVACKGQPEPPLSSLSVGHRSCAGRVITFCSNPLSKGPSLPESLAYTKGTWKEGRGQLARQGGNGRMKARMRGAAAMWACQAWAWGSPADGRAFPLAAKVS